MSLYDYYVEAAKQKANDSSSLVVNKQQMYNMLSAHIPSFQGISTSKMRASTFAMEASRLDVDHTALSSAFNDLYDLVGTTISSTENVMRNSYASSSVIITYYAAVKSFSNMVPYYSHVFVPTIKNVQTSNNIEMIGTVLLNMPNILSTVNGLSFSSDDYLYTVNNNVYVFKYAYDPSVSTQVAEIAVNFPQSKVSFVSFENFSANMRVIGVSVNGTQLDSTQYAVCYIGSYIRVYLASSYETSNITLTVASHLPQHVIDTEASKLQITQKSISAFELKDMYRLSENVHMLTGISHLQNYLKSIGSSVLHTLSSYTFFDISNVIVGYAEFNSNSTLSYKFDEDIYGIRIFPEYPGILVNNQYGSRTFASPIHADTLDVTVAPQSTYIPGMVGYIFSLYR